MKDDAGSILPLATITFPTLHELFSERHGGDILHATDRGFRRDQLIVLFEGIGDVEKAVVKLHAPPSQFEPFIGGDEVGAETTVQPSGASTRSEKRALRLG